MGSTDLQLDADCLAIHEIPDLSRLPDSVSSCDVTDASIVIDNGSFECKAGWSCDDRPRLTFRSHSSKIRGQKGGEIYVGNDIANHEASGWMPLKTPFDKNIATHPDTQEHLFDHIFTKFGFAGDRIDRTVVITEPLCNPNYYRQYMSELLFECYGVPKLLYGIDSILSLEHNLPARDDAVVIALGHAVSHVIPVLGGQICFKRSRRVSYGGQNVSTYLQRLLQLKHPQLSAAIGGIRAEYLTHKFCQFAEDYPAKALNPGTVTVQLPLNSVQNSASATTTAGKMDVCYAIVQKVENVLAKRHQHKLKDVQEKLAQLLAFRKIAIGEEDDRKRSRTLAELGFSTVREVEASIRKLRERQESIIQGDLPHEVDLCHFSDPDSWLLSLRRLREDIKFKISIDEQPTAEHSPSYEELLDRVELIIFETEREFKRGSFINVDELKANSGIYRFYQILLEAERFRAPEILFQPTSFLGLDQAGIVETFDKVLQEFSNEEQERLAKTVFVTGGPACMPGLRARLEREIRALRPFRSEFEVFLAGKPAEDGWHGAKLAAKQFLDFAITKSDYEEFGPDYIRAYKCSNMYAPSPLVVRL